MSVHGIAETQAHALTHTPIFDGLGKHVFDGAKWKGLDHKITYLRSLAICLGKITLRNPKSGA